MLKSGLAVDEDISSAVRENELLLTRSANGFAVLLLRFGGKLFVRKHVCPSTVYT